jgi:hypothetical protein
MTPRAQRAVEKAARALCIADRRDPDKDQRVYYSDGVELMVDYAIQPGKEARWHVYEPKARAALIAALEEMRTQEQFGRVEEYLDNFLSDLKGA